jgi:hypothetical protein
MTKIYVYLVMVLIVLFAFPTYADRASISLDVSSITHAPLCVSRDDFKSSSISEDAERTLAPFHNDHRDLFQGVGLAGVVMASGNMDDGRGLFQANGETWKIDFDHFVWDPHHKNGVHGRFYITPKAVSVPEPGVLALLSVSLLGLAAFGRRTA